MNNLKFIRHITITSITRGLDGQEFLGARWIPFALRRLPASWRRSAALLLLSLSPHYFFRTEANHGLNHKEFLEAEFRRNHDSRQAICDGIVRKYTREDFRVLDYGCGPGFLAKSVSSHVAKIYAADISRGVIASASAINSNPNLEYVIIPESGVLPLPDASIDLAYSFAVIQHVTDEIFEMILGNLHRVLKNGGIALCHIVADGQNWSTEAEWRSDASLRGRIKWVCGLHCFKRSVDDVVRMVTAAGFTKPESLLIRDIADTQDQDLHNQHLFIFNKIAKLS